MVISKDQFGDLLIFLSFVVAVTAHKMSNILTITPEIVNKIDDIEVFGYAELSGLIQFKFLGIV